VAHFILEYSSNLDSKNLALDALFAKLHQSAIDTTLFPLAGIRSRAHCCNDYRIADGNPSYAFVHLEVKLGAGRSDAEKSSAAEAFFNILSQHLDEIFQKQGLAISFEMNELPVTLKYNKNNLREYLK